MCIRDRGKGMPSLIISLIRYLAIIPAAFVLSRRLGPSGVWHAFWIIELIAAAAAGLLYCSFSRRFLHQE